MPWTIEYDNHGNGGFSEWGGHNMSVLTTTQQHIADTSALIAKEKQAMVDHPEEKATLLLSLASLNKLKQQLEEEFAAIAKAE